MTNPKIALTAEDKTAAAFAAVSRRVDKLGVNLGALRAVSVGALGALAIPISAVGLIALTNDARKAIGSIKDLAEVSGSTVENISALDRIARTTGGNLDQVSTTLVKFNQVLKDAEPDKGAGAVLKALNLDIEELKRLDPAEALRLTAVALSGFADDGDKARAIQELFGKSVKETAPFLRDLAEAGKLQATVSTQAAEEVDKFNNQLSLLQANADDAGRAISIGLITEINSVIARFKEGQQEGKNFLQVIFASDADLKRKFAAMNGGAAQSGSRSVSGIITNEGDQSVAEMAKLARGAPPRLSLVVPPDSKNPPKPKGGTPKDPTAEAQRYLEALQRQLEGTQKLTEVEQALRDLQLGRLGKVTDKQRESILNIAAEIDAAKQFEDIAKDFEKLEDERLKREKERKDLIKELVDAGATEQLEKQRDVLQQLTAAYEKGELGIVGSEEALRKYTEAAQAFLGTADEQVKKLSELDQFTQRAAENIQDYLGNSFADILEGNFDNIGDSFTSLINKMVAEAAAAQLSRYLFGDLVGGGSGSGAFGGLFKDVFGSLFGGIPKLDTGTDFVPRDMLAVIHKGEAVVPAAQNRPGSGGGGTNINVSVVMPQGGTRSTALQFGTDAGRQISRATSRNG